MSDHAGAIAVDSALGQGATFEVVIPAYAGEDKSVAPVEQKELANGRGCILFIDDEVHLVEMAQKILGRFGYSVVGETRGQAALDRFLADPMAFDLVVTDQTMPEITGDILAREVRKVRDDIPIILCTGHSSRLTPEQAKEIGIDHYVMKPLLADELGSLVGRALGNSGTAR